MSKCVVKIDRPPVDEKFHDFQVVIDDYLQTTIT